MATKVKISRSFTFKAYRVNGSEEVLNDAHSGEFMLKSECHYYAEKGVLDFVKSNLESVKEDKFTIFKVCTQEDTNVKDMLIELITVKDGEIHID
jgi:hypothetical protein